MSNSQMHFVGITTVLHIYSIYAWIMDHVKKRMSEFDVHGSVHLGNIRSIGSPTRCNYYVFFIPLYI
jgi:hypothetical protein